MPENVRRRDENWEALRDLIQACDSFLAVDDKERFLKNIHVARRVMHDYQPRSTDAPIAADRIVVPETLAANLSDLMLRALLRGEVGYTGWSWHDPVRTLPEFVRSFGNVSKTVVFQTDDDRVHIGYYHANGFFYSSGRRPEMLFSTAKARENFPDVASSLTKVQRWVGLQELVPLMEDADAS